MIEGKQLDIIIECGADFSLYFLVRDSENALVDLTGAVVSAHLREYAEAQDYFAFTATHNGAGGKVTLTMPHEDTAEIGYTRGVYDVFIDFPDETRLKYLWGNVEIDPEVTKPVDGEVIYLLSFASEDSFPLSGLTRRIYFSHVSNKMYRWNGTGYVSIVTNGIDGVDGVSPEIVIGTTTTLPAGSSATVTNSGTDKNLILNFGVPKGYDGQNVPMWGNIEGDLSAQTDLQDVLDEKADISALGENAWIDDAPSDGSEYVRKNGEWAVASGGGGGGGSTAWGDITGTLADQTDLQSALNAKADSTAVYTKTQTDNLLNAKANTADLGYLATQNTVDYATDVTNKPTLGGIQVRPDYEIVDSTNEPTDGVTSLATGKIIFVYEA